VTAQQVQTVAKAILKDKGLNLAVVGPYKKEAAFKKLLMIEE
jgi:hypothetical protein